MSINIRSIIFINGIVVCCLAMAMAVPMIFDLIVHSGKCVGIFASSILASIFFGGLMIFSCRTTGEVPFSRKDVFLLVVSMWTITSIICAFPFYIYSGVKLSFISALFESVSGITVTGATIYPDVEILPRALNLWRFILHFMGGAGIVAIGIFILPIMRIGGMQLFLTENSDKSQRFLPRAFQTVGFFIGIYVLLIGIFVIFLKIAGMGLFDSLCHSISAISTGGFSTRNTGIEWYKSCKIEIIISMAMFVGGITFLEIVRCFKNGIREFLNNQQTKGYLKVVGVMTIVPILITTITSNETVSLNGIASHIFQVISAITTTGLDCSKSYIAPKIVLILLAIIGGCSGSTAGGIKIFRIQILYAVLKNHINKMVRPFDVTIPKYQNKKIDNSLIVSIISLIVILAIVFIVSVAAIELLSGRETLECIYSVTSCLFNLGYDVGFSEFSPPSKLVFIFDMIIGRLEVIPFFIILSKIFWKK